MDRDAAVGIRAGVDLDLERELAVARDLHARLVPKQGRRARRRLGAQDVLRVMRAATDDPEAVATVELRFLIEELLSRGRHRNGARVTREDLVAAGLTIGRSLPQQQKLLSAPTSMARSRDLPSAHAPLRDGPPVPIFHGFDDTLGPEDDREEAPLAERVAARFVAAMTALPFPIRTGTFSASDVLAVLRAHGVEVDDIRLEPGSWPGQANIVGLRDGVPFFGAVAIDLRVDGESATLHAEIRLLAGE